MGEKQVKKNNCFLICARASATTIYVYGNLYYFTLFQGWSYIISKILIQVPNIFFVSFPLWQIYVLDSSQECSPQFAATFACIQKWILLHSSSFFASLATLFNAPGG